MEVLKSKIFKLTVTLVLPLILLSLSSKINVGFGMIDGNAIIVGSIAVFIAGIYITFFKK